LVGDLTDKDSTIYETQSAHFGWLNVSCKCDDEFIPADELD
jgi:hypothetical protein